MEREKSKEVWSWPIFLPFATQVSITTTPGKVDVIEVAEVSEQVKNLTQASGSLSVADVDFTARLLSDLTTAASSSEDTVQERKVEESVSV